MFVSLPVPFLLNLWQIPSLHPFHALLGKTIGPVTHSWSTKTNVAEEEVGEGRGVRTGVMPESAGHYRKGSGGPGRQAAVITHDNPTAWHRWSTRVLLGASYQQGQVPICWARLQHRWTAVAMSGRSAGWLSLTWQGSGKKAVCLQLEIWGSFEEHVRQRKPERLLFTWFLSLWLSPPALSFSLSVSPSFHQPSFRSPFRPHSLSCSYIRLALLFSHVRGTKSTKNANVHRRSLVYWRTGRSAFSQ